MKHRTKPGWTVLLLCILLIAVACENNAVPKGQETGRTVAPTATEVATILPTAASTATSPPRATATTIPSPTATPLPPTPHAIANLSFVVESKELIDPAGTPVFRLDESGQWVAVPPAALLAHLEGLFGPLQTSVDGDRFVLVAASGVVVAELAADTGAWRVIDTLLVLGQRIYEWQGTDYVQIGELPQDITYDTLAVVNESLLVLYDDQGLALAITEQNDQGWLILDHGFHLSDDGGWFYFDGREMEVVPATQIYEYVFENVAVGVSEDGHLRAQGDELFLDFDTETGDWKLGEQEIVFSVAPGYIDRVLSSKPADYYGSSSNENNGYYYDATFHGNDGVSIRFDVDSEGRAQISFAMVIKIRGTSRIFRVTPDSVGIGESDDYTGEHGLTLWGLNPVDVNSELYQSGVFTIREAYLQEGSKFWSTDGDVVTDLSGILNLIASAFYEMNLDSTLHPSSLTVSGQIDGGPQGWGTGWCPAYEETGYIYRRAEELCRRINARSEENGAGLYTSHNQFFDDVVAYLMEHSYPVSSELKEDPELIWGDEYDDLDLPWFSTGGLWLGRVSSEEWSPCYQDIYHPPCPSQG